MKNIAFLTVLALLLSVPAYASYKYSHAEGEYLVELPDAPVAETIWAQNKNVPYIDNPPKYGAVGEVANVKRVDPDNGDIFSVKITFLKTERDFLLELNEQKIKDTLKKDMGDTMLTDSKFRYSKGTGTLKWGTLSGFSVNQNNSVIFNVEHYLAGEASIMIVRVSYSVENKTFNDYYKTLSKSITYIGR